MNSSTTLQHSQASATGSNTIRLDLRLAGTVMQPGSEELKFEVDCHWMRFHGLVSERDFRGLFLDIFGTDPLHVDHDARVKRYPADPGYSHKAMGEYGQFICWRNPNEDGLYDVMVNLSGSWLHSKCGLLQSLELIVRLMDVYSLTPSRVDFALVDYRKVLSVFRLIEAGAAGNFVGCRGFDCRLNGDSEQGLTGVTAYFGSRESDFYLRVYEMTVKHGCQGNRWESELKGDKCKLFCSYLREQLSKASGAFVDSSGSFNSDAYMRFRESFTDGLAVLIAKHVLGQVDFIDKSKKRSSGSLDRCERLPWWQEFLDLVVGGQAVRIRVPVRQPSLKTRGDWMKRQWVKTLAVFYQGLGLEKFYDFVFCLIQDGIRKLKDEDLMWVAVLRNKGLAALLEVEHPT